MPVDPNTKRRYIDVSVSIEGRWRQAGTILLEENGLKAGFSYSNNYTGPPLAPSLDYVRKKRLHFIISNADQKQLRDAERVDLHSVFAQALPGDWAARVMSASGSHLFKRLSPAQKLWEMGDHRVGGLYFQRRDERSYLDKLDTSRKIEESDALSAGRKPVDDEVLLERILHQEREGRGILEGDREKMERSIEQFVTGLALTVGNREHRWALTSNGGQQPKYVYKEADASGVMREFMVKLPEPGRVQYGFEMPRVELAMLETSKKAGLETADYRILSENHRGAAIATARFDRTGEDYRPVHKINMATAFDVSIGTRLDYVDLALKLSAMSAQPERDVKELYGRMLLNVLVNNTDDHLGQFEMLLSKDGWKLAPNFDILMENSKVDGKLMRKHRLTIAGDAEVTPSLGLITRTAAAFKIREIDAFRIASKVLGAVAEIPKAFEKFNVSPETQQSLTAVLRLPELKALKSQVDAGLQAGLRARESMNNTAGMQS